MMMMMRDGLALSPNKGDDDQVYLLWAALASFHSCDGERRLKRTLKKRGMSEKLKRQLAVSLL